MHELASRELFEAECGRLPPGLAASRGWTIQTIRYPLVDVAFAAPGRVGLRVRLTCDDWNDSPPCIELLTSDGDQLPSNQVPKPPNGSNIFHRGNHPLTRKPFICMAGSREYHSHPNHVKDKWDNYRGKSGYDLFGIITQIWSAWEKCVS